MIIFVFNSSPKNVQMGAVHVPGSLVEGLASFTIKLIPIRPEIGPVSVMA